MKHYLGTKIAGIIAVVVSILLLAFVFIFPTIFTNRLVEQIITETEASLSSLEDGDIDTLSEHTANLDRLVSDAVETLKMFYSHDDVAELESAVAKSLQLTKSVENDSAMLVMSLCDVIEQAEHIRDCYNIGWSELL